MRDYSQVDDPYGIAAEYTSQSAAEPSKPMRDLSVDARGNPLCVPRGIPTQEEADAVKAGRT